MATDPTAWHMEARADAWAADLGQQDPAPAPAERAWQQQEIRTAYEDAAHLTEQPR
ncbi:hypothetical protein [Streptomyces shenzhenensis]|uniref:hypothetical protein n=1 Tax=Streptomyces shenzhenensis TaxID=943815 RepID=UPI0015F0D6BC|nr:hypothetical protein [Streptomyces shenzhenensis]